MSHIFLKMTQFLENLQKPPKNTIYLSFLRLFICFHLLKKALIFITSSELLYGKNSFINHDGETLILWINPSFLRDNYQVVLIIYIFFITLYFFGIGKNITALVVFLLFKTFQNLNGMISNGGDNLLYFVLLYLVFTDTYKYFSVTKIKYRSNDIEKISNLLSNLCSFSIVLHLCVVYFFSAIGKINTSEWYKGVAIYYTLLCERFNGTRFNDILAKNGYFTTIATYFTLAFELLFPFFIWNKKWRIPLIVSGILLHVGIYIFMMIHDFEILFIALYGLFFNDDELKSLKNYLSAIKYPSLRTQNV